MRRRDFIKGIVGAATAWPLAAHAQQPAKPVIGFLRSASLANAGPLVTAFRQGLKEAGYVEGQNVVIEFRSAEGHNDELPKLVAELLRLPVAVMVCNVTAASAAKAITSSVPIVFATGDDPVAEGLVASLNRPGGNVTGVSFLGNALGAKQVELLRQLVPKATTIAVLVDTNYQGSVTDLKDVERAAHSFRQNLIILRASNERDLETASATLAQQRADALIALGAAFFLSQRDQIIALAARHQLPAIYQVPDFAVAGGLMSYGASIRDAYRLVGIYSGKILNGAKPADLPVEQSTKVELVINLKTAKALGITLPQSILVAADEVIE
ncbi:MAG TPA: ABC transporter substrate-binding protein [Xanthobacteraceae bacterium]|nr:ABC transporter substrate-binding protein [Xanthobacteraceae bacterium]